MSTPIKEETKMSDAVETATGPETKPEPGNGSNGVETHQAPAQGPQVVILSRTSASDKATGAETPTMSPVTPAAAAVPVAAPVVAPVRPPASARVVLDDEQILALLSSPDIDHMVGGCGRRFVEWLSDQGTTIDKMGPGLVEKYCRERYSVGASFNSAVTQLHRALDVLKDKGVACAPISWPKRDPLTKAAQIPVRGTAPDAMPLPSSMAGVNVLSLARQPPAQPVQPAPEPAPEYAEARIVPVPVPRPAKATPTPLPRTGTGADGLPLGGIYKVSKKSNGAIPGIPAGALIEIGNYQPASIGNDVRKFILEAIRPQYGPRAGEMDTVYVVEHMDARGQPTRVPVEINVAAPIGVMTQAGVQQIPVGSGGYTGYGPGYGGQPVTPAPAQPPAASDRILDMMVARNNQLESKLDAMLTDGGKKGSDPMAFMSLMEMRRQSDEMKMQIEEMRKKAAVPAPTPAPAPTPDLGRYRRDDMGGLPWDTGPAQPDAMLELTKTLVDKVTSTPAAAAVEQNPLMPLLTAILPSLLNKAPAGPDPIMMEMLRSANDRVKSMEDKYERLIEAHTKPEKTKSLGESLNDMTALLAFKERLEPQASPPGVLDAVMHAIENADKIGEAIGRAAAASAAGRAPMVGGQLGGMQQQQQQQHPPQPSRQPAPAAAQQQPPPFPKPAKDAVREMYDAVSDQDIVTALFKLVGVMGVDPTWKPVAEVIGRQFVGADSRNDLRAMVVNTMNLINAKPLTRDNQFLDKVSDCLHRNYTALYATLTEGKMPPKTLADVEAPAIVTPAPVAAAPSPAPSAAAPSTTPVATPAAPVAAPVAPSATSTDPTIPPVV